MKAREHIKHIYKTAHNWTIIILIIKQVKNYDRENMYFSKIFNMSWLKYAKNHNLNIEYIITKTWNIS